MSHLNPEVHEDKQAHRSEWYISDTFETTSNNTEIFRQTFVVDGRTSSSNGEVVISMIADGDMDSQNGCRSLTLRVEGHHPFFSEGRYFVDFIRDDSEQSR